MRLSVFDPRGAVASAHVAHDGRNGVDSNPSKQQLNIGQALLVELGLPAPADAAVAGSRPNAMIDQGEAVYKSGSSIICSKGAKSEPDLSHVTKIFCQIIGAAGRKTRLEPKPSRPWQGQHIFFSYVGVAGRRDGINLRLAAMHRDSCGNLSNA